MKHCKKIVFIVTLLIVVQSCNHDKGPKPFSVQKAMRYAPYSPGDSTLFYLLTPGQTGVRFRNDIVEDSNWNALKYNYAYNGGGVAIGDIDNDGLPDIVFTSNQKGPAVYLNKGGMKFEDITEKSGVIASDGWTTGVTLADVNGDGWLDIYICKGGSKGGRQRENRLFINNHDRTFTERGKEYGLNVQGPSTQAVFFDYDNDGDLDCFIINHPENFDQIQNPFAFCDTATLPTGQDKLMENVNGHFIDVTEKAGLSHTYGYGLSVSVCDINHDGFDDLYVANDYASIDQLFINSGRKTFSEQTSKYFTQVPLFSMGSDYADLNNDGLQDLMVVDMKPDNHYRVKHNLIGFPQGYYNYFLNHFSPPQYIKNTVQLATDTGKYSEVAQLLGMSETDWSWSILIQDFDNDGWNDVHVTNGTKRDVHDLDFLTIMEDQYSHYGFSLPTNNFYLQLRTTTLPDYAFHNLGNLKFEDVSAKWGINLPSISNGAAYADLDGDGNVDLVVNNTDADAFIFKNRATALTGNNYLRLRLHSNTPNTFGIGAQATIYYDHGKFQTKELRNGRGFESCSEPVIHFGLGRVAQVDSVIVKWHSSSRQVLENVKANQVLTLEEAKAVRNLPSPVKPAKRFLTEVKVPGLQFTHQESDFSDFKSQRLIPFRYSRQGPGLAIADVNGDGLEDVFIGNGKGHTAKLFVQDKAGRFAAKADEPWEHDSTFETMGCVFFDFNGDGFLDLYVAVGSNEYNAGDPAMKDRLYLNDGKGRFKDISHLINFDSTSHSCVVAADIDNDGDKDLFVGGWLTPGNYPLPGKSHILRNDNNQLTDITEKVAPGLKDCGMVNAAAWFDYDNDGHMDLIVAGDWMPVRFFHNENGKFIDRTEQTGLPKTDGFWKSLAIIDVNGDGKPDLVAGNLGENTFLKADSDKPLSLWLNDFDHNGVPDPIMFYYLKGQNAPFADRNTLCEQMPKFRKKFFTFESYATADWSRVFEPGLVEKAKKCFVYNTSTCWFENLGNGKFKEQRMPIESQFAPIFSIIADDFDHDGKPDLLLNGNWFSNYYSNGNFDAFRGLLMLNGGNGSLTPAGFKQSGFYNDEDGKSMGILHTADGKKLVIVTNSNGPVKIFRCN